MLVASSLLLGEGCPHAKKLVILEARSGDLAGERGGDLGRGLFRLEAVLEALLGGWTVLVEASWMSELGRSRSSCGGMDLRPNMDMIGLLDSQLLTAEGPGSAAWAWLECRVAACAVPSEPDRTD